MRTLFVAGVSLSVLGSLAHADDETIYVTGSRIARPDLQSVSPVLIIDRDQIDISGANSAQDLVSLLPQAGVPGLTDTNSNFNTLGGGVNQANLRNLGHQRTLVLVNGRRHVGGLPGSPVVDLAMIPTPLIERAEVVTGGASAVYGSEAITGVVNFILADEYEGLEANIRYGDSFAGGAEDFDASIIAGTGFADDRGNIVVHLGYSDRGALQSKDRDISANDIERSPFGAAGAYVIPGSGLFTQDAETSLFNKGFVLPEDGYNRNPDRLIRVPTERWQFNTQAKLDLSESVTVIAEVGYSTVQAYQRLEPTQIGEGTSVGDLANIRMPTTNAFFPGELTNRFIFSPQPEEVIFLRRFTELGFRTSDIERETLRTVFGLEGKLPWADGFEFDLYYQYGRLGQEQDDGGIANTLNVVNALDTEPDGTGGFQCADAAARADGCVPINFFGAGSVSPEALAYVQVGASHRARMVQEVIAGSVTGDLIELPAGPLGIAAGFEYRSEESAFISDPLAASGLTTANVLPSERGEYDVTEFFVEAQVPLLKKKPLADYLGIEGAIRYANYSTIGATEAYKLGASWRPVPDLTVRGSFNTAVRAPFITELFNPGFETFRTYRDPCNLGGRGGLSSDGRTTYATQSAEVQARCAAIPGTATLDQGALNIFTAGGISAGNPDLNEETAETYTFGLVLSPSGVPGLNVTVDYYTITIEDAISTFSAQDTVDQCLRQPDFPDNPFCGLITRDASTGLIRTIDALAINVAELRAEGVDFAVDYAFDVGPVDLAANLAGNFRIKETFLPFAGGERIEDTGEVGSQDWTINGTLTGKWRDLRASWSTRYLSGVNIDNENPMAGPPEAGGKIDPYFYHDINLSWAVTDQFDLTLGVDNVFDEEPPLLGQGVNGDLPGTNTASDVYDVIGRYGYVSVRARL